MKVSLYMVKEMVIENISQENILMKVSGRMG